MKLEKWALIAEIIGGAAIVVSLIFVALEIRRNTEATQAATFQATVAYDVDLLLSQGRDPDTATVFNVYRIDPGSLSGGELEQGMLLAAASLRHMENLYLQHEAGMLSDEAWRTRESLIRSIVDAPGMMGLLQDERFWSGAFVEYIDGVRAETTIPD